MFKIIREDDVVYFCNAVGEVFCWDFHTKYEAAWSAVYGFPCYIALVDGVPCLLLIAEFGDLPDN